MDFTIFQEIGTWIHYFLCLIPSICVTDFRGFHKISNIVFHDSKLLDIEDDKMSLTTCFTLCTAFQITPFYAMVSGERCVCAKGELLIVFM